MTQNVLLLASHGIAEYDDVRMFARLGYDVFCPGGYADPKHPGETLRPPIPEAPDHPELRALCDEQQRKHTEDPGIYIDWAKADLHPELIDWADVIIVHHFVDRWIGGQWPFIKRKRVVWRTCGQSDPYLERAMRMFARDGLEIVRYSPKEKAYFESVGAFAGEDAVIRFGKYPDDYGPWIPDGTIQYPRGLWPEYVTHDGGGPFIANVTQDMLGRAEATGLDFYLAATAGLPARPAGPGSEKLLGGTGAMPYSDMLAYLARARAYLYTGTTPASYTLGLIEAMLSGVPVVSIGPGAWAGPDALFEGHELVNFTASDDPAEARGVLRELLDRPDVAKGYSEDIRRQAIDLFGMDTIGPQWLDFLGYPVPKNEKATPVSRWDAVLA